MKKKQLFFLLATIVWGLFIWMQSTKTGTDSGHMSDQIVSVLQMFFPLSKDLLSFLVRKAAHFTEYFIFSALLCLTAHSFHRLLPRFDGSILFIGTLWAVLDEWIQTFIPGRAGCVQDVLIDTAGVCLAFFIIRLILSYIAKRKERKSTLCSVSSAICEKPSQNLK